MKTQQLYLMIKEYAALMGKTAFNEELGGRLSEDFVHKQMKTILDDGKLIANIESYLQLEARAEIPASDQSESFLYLDPLVYLFPQDSRSGHKCRERRRITFER
jgi:hypothetical protein